MIQHRQLPVLKDWYEVLQVQPDCTFDELKKAYHSLAKKYHPDRLPGNDRMMQAINAAYEIGLIAIKVPKERREVEHSIIVGKQVGRGVRNIVAFLGAMLYELLAPAPSPKIRRTDDWYPNVDVLKSRQQQYEQPIIINIGNGHQVNIKR